MKKLLALIGLLSVLISCNHTKQKDEAYNALHQKIIVDAVSVDNDGTEVNSGFGSATLPK